MIADQLERERLREATRELTQFCPSSAGALLEVLRESADEASAPADWSAAERARTPA